MQIQEDISKKLLSFQIAHVYQLQECLQLRNRVIDASDTGTGKTYCAIATCALLKLTPFIICPKSVISNWGSVLSEDNTKHKNLSSTNSFGHPRMSIISPSWSGQEMRQTLGRIHRAGSKTPAIQKIIYVAKTYEEQMCNIIKVKLRNIDAINDGELSEYNLNEIHYEEDKQNKQNSINKDNINKDNINKDNINKDNIYKDNIPTNIELKPKTKYIKKNK
jgi:superfamily II DNA or RNA helicase